MKSFLYLIVSVLIIALLYSFYFNVTQKPNSKRVACQKKTTCFEKISSSPATPKAIELLKTGQYLIESRIEFSRYMPSHLIDILTHEQADALLEGILKKQMTSEKEASNKLIINYYIYENDKQDKGKKNKNAKEYAGYIVFEFKLNNESLYKIQIDYMNLEASDLEDRMSCAIDSFLTL